jgi:hypothetical protein
MTHKRGGLLAQIEADVVDARVPLSSILQWLRRESFETRDPMNTIVVTALEELRTRRQRGAM